MNILLSLLWMTLSHASAQKICSIDVQKTLFPMEGENYHQGLCINDYFLKRDLTNFSTGEDKFGLPLILNDTVQMVFDDMLLIQTPIDTTTDANRIELIKRIYASYMNSLKNQYGSCELIIKSGDKKLTVNDLKVFERTANDQTGSRLMLTKDDVTDPRWMLICPNQAGDYTITKSGNYFFMFIDLYGNDGKTNLKGNLVQFLMSFR